MGVNKCGWGACEGMDLAVVAGRRDPEAGVAGRCGCEQVWMWCAHACEGIDLAVVVFPLQCFDDISNMAISFPQFQNMRFTPTGSHHLLHTQAHLKNMRSGNYGPFVFRTVVFGNKGESKSVMRCQVWGR